MQLQWIQHSLGRKVMALVCLLSFLVFGALFFVTRSWQRSLALERLDRAEHQLAGTMKLALDSAMVQGDKDQMSGFFQRAGGLNQDVSIHLVAPENKIEFSSRPAMVQSDATQLFPAGELRDALAGSLSRQTEVGRLADLNGTPHYVYFRSIENEPRCFGCHGQDKPILGSMVLLQDMSGDWKAMAHQSWALATLSLVGMGLLVLSLSYFIRRGITIPLVRFGGVLDQVAAGDFRQAPETSASDEIGDMGKALLKTVQSLRTTFQDVTHSGQTIAAASTELSALSQQMAEGTRNTSQKASTVAAAAEEMSVNAASVAAGMEQATASLTSISESTSQMTSSISEIASNSEKARTITQEANRQAEGMGALMKNLGRAAQEIGKVTETINNISSQTNLLALNATIEAARAGSAGKGFAVVAGEIKELALQTAAATEDIKGKIADIQNSTAGAAANIQKISGVIRDVGDIVSTIATAIEEQSVVTRDIASNLAQASAGVQDANYRVAQSSVVSQSIASEIAAVDASANEIAAGVDQVKASAQDLSQLAERLHQTVKSFRV